MRMNKRRIESATSRTAEITCLSRAVSSLETSSQLSSGDYLAVALLPSFFQVLVRIPLFRQFHRRVFAPAGAYEYVIARTRYIDSVFTRAMAEGFEQALLFGAGFDTRALRFQVEARQANIFELDAPPTQQAKIQQYRRRRLDVPPNLCFIAMDFERDALPERLDQSGFLRGRKTLFILEGLLMYLESVSVAATLSTIQEVAGAGSWAVFDYVKASVLRPADRDHGDEELLKTVSRVGEQWRFGIEPGEVRAFLATYGFALNEHKDADDLEQMYFMDSAGRRVARVNRTHNIVLAARR
jgi:methyltransferase (TIGR00027 family)